MSDKICVLDGEPWLCIECGICVEYDELEAEEEKKLDVSKES